MANDRITVWLRMRNLARFHADAKRAEHDVKNIGDAANNAGSPLNQLGGALSEFASSVPDVTGRTRLFGFAIGTVVTAFVALIPLVVGLGGGLTALAGSLGAAALGAGVLAVGLAGALIPAGALGLVAMDLLKSFNKVNTAFQRYQVAVGAYGKGSTQAETALARLNAVAEVAGGRYLITLADRWDKFMKVFRIANRPAMHQIVGILSDLLVAGRTLLPVFAQLAHWAATALREALGPALADITSPGTINMLYSLGDAFKSLAGPLIQASINILMGLLNLAVRSTGYLHPLTGDIVAMSEAFRNWATSGNIGVLVGQFYSWLGLLKAVGRLLITILTGGASDGQNMVQALTGVVNKWNAFLSTKEGQDSLRKFFRDAVTMTVEFTKVLAGVTAFMFKFGRAMVPLYTVVFKALRGAWNDFMDALRPAKPFWDHVLKPLLAGLIGGILGGVVGAFKFLMIVTKGVMYVLGALGKVLAPLGTVFKILGWIIGFFLGGEILKLLEGLGKLSIVLKPIGALFRLLGAPIRMAGGLLGWLVGRFGALLTKAAELASGLPGAVGRAINGVIDWLVGRGAGFFNAGVRLMQHFRDGLMSVFARGIGFGADVGKSIYNWLARRINRALPDKVGPHGIINLPDNPLPLLAGGGSVSGSGSWITGEMGPELNTLTPTGHVVVQPLAPGIQAQGTSATLDPRGGKRVLVSKVYLRGRQIAEAVADEADDDLARRGG